MENGESVLISLGIVLLGLLGLTIYVLTVALRDAVRRIGGMNERLMVLLGTRDGGPEVGRALVASQRPPKKQISGVAGEGGKEPPKGYKITVGAR